MMVFAYENKMKNTGLFLMIVRCILNMSFKAFFFLVNQCHEQLGPGN